MKKRFILAAMFSILMAFSVVPQSSHAALNAVGPVDPGNGFPVWYQDSNGLGLSECLSQATNANGSLCALVALPGFDPALPIVFPTNFPNEVFYWSGNAVKMPLTGGGSADLIMALEGAFSGQVVLDGDQITFARIRIRIDTTVAGTYRLTHPYGVLVLTNVPVGTRAINSTKDIGLRALFTGALSGAIGPFLRATAGPIVVGTETFIGDPNIAQTVTGSPFGTNFFRVEVDSGAGFVTLGETNLFNISGLVFNGVLPSPLVAERATYARTAAGAGSVDIFATSAPGASLIYQGGPNLPISAQTMTGDGAGRFYAHTDLADATVLPANVNVTASNPTNSPTILAKQMVDSITITKAEYNPVTGVLAVAATSGDLFSVPTLSVVGIGPISGGTSSFSVVAPPAKITVVSSAGGEETVSVAIVSGGSTTAPPPPTNTAPIFISVPITVATPSIPYAYAALAVDTPGDVLTYSLTAAPLGMTINPATGSVSWTPTLSQVGANPVTVTVTDQGGLFATQSFSVTVQTIPPPPTNTAPIFISAPVTSGTVGAAYSYIAVATDTPGDILTYSLTTAPAGMTINPSTGVISWTPTAAQAGTNPVTVTVTDQGGLFATQSFSITVLVPPPANTAPQFISAPITSATAGVLYTYIAVATDTPGDILTYSLTTAPAGMTINPSTGVISWTPTAAQAGTNPVTVTVTDQGGLFATQSFSITVQAQIEVITVLQAEFRTQSGRWTIKGSTTQPGSSIEAFLTNTGQLIGGDTAAGGSWTIRSNNGPVAQAGDTITVRSAGGAVTVSPIVVRK